MDGPHSDELSRNAMGGTELMKHGLYRRVDPELLDRFQIVVSRQRELRDKPRIFWAHDLAGDPEVAFLKDPQLRAAYARIVFVSHWQKATYQAALGVPPSLSVVLQNAIDPIPAGPRAPSDTLRLIYASTPHRGLDILLKVFDRLHRERGGIELDVFSSFGLYGWPQRDKPFAELFAYCREHPAIRYHGAVEHDRVRQAFAEAHILAYPSTWEETSCLVAVEALSAGCLAVTSTLAALPETCANFARLYPFHEDRAVHAERFYRALGAALDSYWDRPVQALLEPQRNYFNTFYSWELRATQWTGFLTGLATEA